MASGSLTVLITPQSNYIVSPSRNTGSPVVINPQPNYVVSTDRTVVSQVQPASRYVDSARVAVSASYATNSDISISSSFAEVSNTSSYADNFNVDGAVTASTFKGDGSLLTGIVAQGVGILIDEDSIVQGVAERLDFQDGLDVTVFGGTGSISLNRTGSFSGSFSGDGSGMTNVASALYAVSSSHLSGGNAENIGYVDFDTTYVPGTHTTGRFYWDDANKTVALDMFGSDVRLQLGQEQHLYVRNVSGVTINNGDAVRITGASGNNITVEKALSTIGGILNQNNGEVIGVATENIDNNSNGYVTTYGTVNNIDTSTLVEGSEVYVSSLVSGAIVGEQPPAPYEEIQIGVVEKSHPTIGKLFVRPQRGVHFSEIATVTGSNIPVGNSYLEYDSVTGITSFVDTVQSSSYATSASYVDGANVTGVVSSSYAITADTASYVNPLVQDVDITGSLELDGEINGVLIGRGTGSDTIDNTVLGFDAAVNNTTGADITAIGRNALLANTTGTYHTAVGSNALSSNEGNFFNTAVGYRVMNALESGSYNTAVGSNALANWTGVAESTFNVAVGAQAMQNASGSTTGNVAIGGSALQKTRAAANVAIGYLASRDATTGGSNTAVGYFASLRNEVGAFNAAVGYQSLQNSISGSSNTAMGSRALYDLADKTDNDYNTTIGYEAGRGIVTGSNNTIVGARTSGLPASLSNTIIIADGEGNYGLYVSSSQNAQLYGGVTAPSFTGSFSGDGSQVTGVVSSSYALTADTASYVNPLVQDVDISGILDVTGDISGSKIYAPYRDGHRIGHLRVDYLSGGNPILRSAALTDPTIYVGSAIVVTSHSGISAANAGYAVDFPIRHSRAGDYGIKFTTRNDSGSADVQRLRIPGGDSDDALMLISNVSQLEVQAPISASSFTGSFSGDGSQVTGVISSSYAITADTASYVNPLVQDVEITGSLELDGTINGVLIGRGTGSDTANNTVLGFDAAANNTTGTQITAIGRNALLDNTTGQYHTAVGYSALRSITGGLYNTAVGQTAMNALESGSYNTAVGASAMANWAGASPPTWNVAVGAQAMQSASGSGVQTNVAVGGGALKSIRTGATVAVGFTALQNTTTGGGNTAIGTSAMHRNRVGSNNVAVGRYALYYNTSGSNNTAIGYRSLYDLADPNTNDYNTTIGRDAGRGIVTGSNNTIVGARIDGLPASLSNTIIIGDGEGNYGLYISSSRNAQLYGGVTAPSFTGSFSGDGSNITGVVSSSHAITADTASYVDSSNITGVVSASYVEHLNQIVAVTGSINVTGSGIITEDMILRKEDQQVLFRSVITKNVYSETRQIEPTIPTGSYSGCQIEYHITKASATRQGVVLGTWLNGQINYTDVSNLGIGDSDDLNFDMILSSGQATLRAVSSGTDSQPWQIHTFLKAFSNIV